MSPHVLVVLRVIHSSLWACERADDAKIIAYKRRLMCVAAAAVSYKRRKICRYGGRGYQYRMRWVLRRFRSISLSTCEITLAVGSYFIKLQQFEGISRHASVASSHRLAMRRRVRGMGSLNVLKRAADKLLFSTSSFRSFPCRKINLSKLWTF